MITSFIKHNPVRPESNGVGRPINGVRQIKDAGASHNLWISPKWTGRTFIWLSVFGLWLDDVWLHPGRQTYSSAYENHACVCL